MAVDASTYSTIGALEIGVMIGLFLFGISTAQASIYYQRFPQDPLQIKSLVRSPLDRMTLQSNMSWLDRSQPSGLFVSLCIYRDPPDRGPSLRFLDVAHSILTSCLVYTLAVTYYGRAEQLHKFTCLNTLILFGAAMTWTEQVRDSPCLLACLTRCLEVFFSYRIYRIMDRSILGVICFALSSARFIACIYLAVGAFREPTFRSLTHHYGWLMTAVLVGSASVDVIIAASLCYSLIHRRDHNLRRYEG